MPDGDIIHARMPRRYQQVYRQVLQDHHTPQQLAHAVLVPLRQDLRDYGSDTIDFLVWAGEQLDDAGMEPILRRIVDRDALKQTIECRARQLGGHRYGMQLAVDACERSINDLLALEGDVEIKPQLMTQFLMCIYTARFEAFARVPLDEPDAPEHMTVIETLNEMRPHVESYLGVLAEQAVRHKCAERLRLPPSPHNTPVELHEDLRAPMS